MSSRETLERKPRFEGDFLLTVTPSEIIFPLGSHQDTSLPFDVTNYSEQRLQVLVTLESVRYKLMEANYGCFPVSQYYKILEKDEKMSLKVGVIKEELPECEGLWNKMEWFNEGQIRISHTPVPDELNGQFLDKCNDPLCIIKTNGCPGEIHLVPQNELYKKLKAYMYIQIEAEYDPYYRQLMTVIDKGGCNRYQKSPPPEEYPSRSLKRDGKFKSSTSKGSKSREMPEEWKKMVSKEKMSEPESTGGLSKEKIPPNPPVAPKNPPKPVKQPQSSSNSAPTPSISPIRVPNPPNVPKGHLNPPKSSNSSPNPTVVTAPPIHPHPPPTNTSNNLKVKKKKKGCCTIV